MNRENVLYMKQIMMSAKNLEMNFQYGEEDCHSIDELHSCGNTACFAGYMALSEKFQADGGDVGRWGGPILIDSGFESSQYVCQDDEVVIAVAKWLGISEDLADQIIFNSYDFYPQKFGVYFQDVKPEHLIQVMDMILDGELK